LVAVFALLIGFLWPSTVLQLIAGAWLGLNALLGLGWLWLKTRQLSEEGAAPAVKSAA
jgi:hypothetical protein